MKKNNYCEFISLHPEYEYEKLKGVALHMKKVDTPFYDTWRTQFENYCLDYVGAIPHSISLFEDCQGDFDLYDEEIEKQQNGFSLAQNVIALINNTNSRLRTLRDHLNDVFSAFPNKVLFGTYTFKPEKLPKTEEEALAMDKRVREVLYTYSDYFIVNRDYRPKSGALHYHWYMGGVNRVDYRDWDKKWGYGTSYVEHAYLNSRKTARYLYKTGILAKHALKGSTKGTSIYYSKGVQKLARERKKKK